MDIFRRKKFGEAMFARAMPLLSESVMQSSDIKGLILIMAISKGDTYKRAEHAQAAVNHVHSIIPLSINYGKKLSEIGHRSKRNLR